MGIGPSTKETTLHHFRDPLLEVVTSDNDVDLLGIIVAGTPQSNEDKVFVAERAAAWAEAMRVDGVIVSIDGWGNSNIDFATAVGEVGRRNIPVVGMSFVGTVGYVVTNKYMDTIVDFNKSKEGIETEVVGENTVTTIDAKKALAFLKLKMRNRRNEV